MDEPGREVELTRQIGMLVQEADLLGFTIVVEYQDYGFGVGIQPVIGCYPKVPYGSR